jgi:hypothetical protein
LSTLMVREPGTQSSQHLKVGNGANVLYFDLWDSGPS